MNVIPNSVPTNRFAPTVEQAKGLSKIVAKQSQGVDATGGIKEVKVTPSFMDRVIGFFKSVVAFFTGGDHLSRRPGRRPHWKVHRHQSWPKPSLQPNSSKK